MAKLTVTHGGKFILIHVVTISARGSGVVGVEDEEEDEEEEQDLPLDEVEDVDEDVVPRQKIEIDNKVCSTYHT